MFEKKLLELLQRLHKKAVNQSLDWNERSSGVFETTLGQYSLNIKAQTDPDYPDQPDYVVGIQDPTTGGNIEEFSNVSLRGISEGVNPAPYALFEETYNIARRSARGVEKAVDSLIEELEKDDDIPF